MCGPPGLVDSAPETWAQQAVMSNKFNKLTLLYDAAAIAGRVREMAAQINAC